MAAWLLEEKSIGGGEGQDGPLRRSGGTRTRKLDIGTIHEHRDTMPAQESRRVNVRGPLRERNLNT